LDWLSWGEQWKSLCLLIWHIRSCMLCPAGAKGMRSDQWQNKQMSHFFQDLDWLSCGERWQSLHLLIWYVRSCMLCSASANDMTSDQWQQFQFAHTFSQDLDWLPSDNSDQVFICWYDTVYKKLLLCPSCTVYLALVLLSSWEYNTDKTMTVYLELTLNSHLFPRSRLIVFR
jgi:hypothetical protein